MNMEEFLRAVFPKAIAAFAWIDVLMFLCGVEKTVTGWILDKLGL